MEWNSKPLPGNVYRVRCTLGKFVVPSAATRSRFGYKGSRSWCDSLSQKPFDTDMGPFDIHLFWSAAIFLAVVWT